MAAEDQLYPMSTEKGDAIPLDIVRPLGAKVAAIAANAHTVVAFPPHEYVSLRASIDCAVDFTATATYPFTESTSAVILHADGVHTIQIPAPIGSFRVIPLRAGEDGFITINGIQKWAGLGLNRQLNRR